MGTPLEPTKTEYIYIHRLIIPYYVMFSYINKTKKSKHQNYLDEFWFEAERLLSVFLDKAKKQNVLEKF